MSTSCKGLIAKYSECLRKSECMTQEHKTARQCMNDRPQECEGLMQALFRCKRGQMDARSRLQGNKGF